jgi:hypothetical protein
VAIDAAAGARSGLTGISERGRDGGTRTDVGKSGPRTPPKRSACTAPVGFRISVSHGVSQTQLQVHVVASQAENFSLRGSDQQIHHLGRFRLAGLIFLKVDAGGKHLNVLEQSSRPGSVQRVAAGGHTRDENVHTHAGNGKSGDTCHLIDSDRAGSHSRGNRAGQTATGTQRSEARLSDRFAFKNGSSHSALQDAIGFADRTFRNGTRPRCRFQIGSGDHGSGYEIAHSNDDRDGWNLPHSG